MAIARVECTCKTCGKTFEVKATRANSTQAREFEEWAAKHIVECDECAARRAEAAKAERYSDIDTSDYCELRGSEKQVAWANDIRHEFVAQEIDPLLGKSTLTPTLPKGPIDYADLRAYAVQISDAKWWIDARGDMVSIMRALLTAWRRAREAQPASEAPRTSEPADAAGQQPAADATETPAAETVETPVTVPETATHTGVAEISVRDGEVSVLYGRDDDYIAVVKGLGYRYDGARKRWRKAITQTTGSAAERAAELGSKLLNAGFAVRIEDPQIRAAAVRGDYEPETARWIDAVPAGGSYAGWLSIAWGRDDRDMYDRARRLRRSRYDHGKVVVPATEWQDVMDFAGIYDYRLTDAARAAVEAQRRSMEIVSPAPARAAGYAEHPLSDVLDSSCDVLPDLRDEP